MPRFPFVATLPAGASPEPVPPKRPPMLARATRGLRGVQRFGNVTPTVRTPHVRKVRK